MLIEIGHDLVAVSRIRRAIERQGQSFLDRIFTPKEQAYCRKYRNPFPHFAGRFAAKEALAKALGTGIGKETGWLDFEILPDEKGKPQIFLSPRLQQKMDVNPFRLSITHDQHIASATALYIPK